MKTILLGLSMLFISVGLIAEPIGENEGEALPFRAALSKQTTPGGQKQLILYTEEEISQVEYALTGAQGKFPLVKATDTEGVFFTRAFLPVEEGRQFTVTFRDVEGEPGKLVLTLATKDDGKTLISIEELEATEEDVSAVAPPVQPSKVETAPSARAAAYLDDSTVLHGSSQVDPQALAQARANRMAQSHYRGHLGSGIVMTLRGRLAEGVGWGQGTFPSTCTATNGTAAIADAHAVAQDGTIYRVRLYDSPGTTNGGGGGFRMFGRRR